MKFKKPNFLSAVQPVLTSFLDLVYPRDCINCGNLVEDDRFDYICSHCVDELYRVEQPWCATCGFPFYGMLESDRNCPHCVELAPVFEKGRTLFLYRALGRTLIHELKYHRAHYLLGDFRRLIWEAKDLGEFLAGATLVPVPLYHRKLRERGFNQSLLLARCVAEVFGKLPVENLLERTIDTATQTRLGREKRIKNMENAFGLKAGAPVVAEKKYVVVDDVFTTGATLNACCSTLRAGGAQRLRVLTLGHG